MGFSLNRHGKVLVPNVLILMVVVLMVCTTAYGTDKFYDVFEPTFGNDRIKTSNGDHLASLYLDQYSGSGFRSKKDYLFGRVDMQLQLVPGDSSGTVTTFYLTSDQSTGRHDEIDFEFLGNVSGQPYTLHTNIYSQGKGNREQQFHLWFDPTARLHTYSIVWNARLIMFLVDDSPIRVFRSNEDVGVPFPKNQPMRIQCSLWSAEWATQGGRIKTDWSKAPFKATYGNSNIDACVASSPQSKHACANAPATPGSWRTHDLDPKGRKRLKTVQKRYMIYNYCKDAKRFPQGYPKECERD